MLRNEKALFNVLEVLFLWLLPMNCNELEIITFFNFNVENFVKLSNLGRYFQTFLTVIFKLSLKIKILTVIF